MSDWIDFCVYATMAVLLWIALPRWAARFARPLLVGRNPAWAESHPVEVSRMERGWWLHKTLQAWGVISVLVLLVFQLRLQPDFLTAATPSWRLLSTLSSGLMLGGFLIMGVGALHYLRWLKHNVPLAEKRRATLVPRTVDQYAPRWLQWPLYGLAIAHLAVWLYFGISGERTEPAFWGGFAANALLTALIIAVGVGAVRRRPNSYDLALGPAYRLMEVRMYLSMLLLVIANGSLWLYGGVAGVDVRRFSNLLLGLFIIGALARLARMRAPDSPASSPGSGQLASP